MHASYGLSVFFYLLNHLTVNIKPVKKTYAVYRPEYFQWNFTGEAIGLV